MHWVGVAPGRMHWLVVCLAIASVAYYQKNSRHVITCRAIEQHENASDLLSLRVVHHSPLVRPGAGKTLHNFDRGLTTRYRRQQGHDLDSRTAAPFPANKGPNIPTKDVVVQIQTHLS